MLLKKAWWLCFSLFFSSPLFSALLFSSPPRSALLSSSLLLSLLSFLPSPTLYSPLPCYSILLCPTLFCSSLASSPLPSPPLLSPTPLYSSLLYSALVLPTLYATLTLLLRYSALLSFLSPPYSSTLHYSTLLLLFSTLHYATLLNSVFLNCPYIYIHMIMHVCAHMYVRICMCAYVCVHMYVCICIFFIVNVDIYVRVCMYIVYTKCQTCENIFLLYQTKMALKECNINCERRRLKCLSVCL
jgi:hypothetical protein